MKEAERSKQGEWMGGWGMRRAAAEVGRREGRKWERSEVTQRLVERDLRGDRAGGEVVGDGKVAAPQLARAACPGSAARHGTQACAHAWRRPQGPSALPTSLQYARACWSPCSSDPNH
jgi:hypothetical protein